jgi:hypothetical protein
MADFSKYMQIQMDGIFSILSIHLSAKAERTAITLNEFISVLKEQGLGQKEIKDALYQDIKTQGRIFGEFFNGFGTDVRGAMNNLSHSAKIGKMGFELDEQLIWEIDSENPCPDCLRRNGEIDSFQNWQIRGLPGTGWSVCRENCLCNLVRVEQMDIIKNR